MLQIGELFLLWLKTCFFMTFDLHFTDILVVLKVLWKCKKKTKKTMYTICNLAGFQL